MPSPYAAHAPSPQQTIDLFKDKWASKMPPSLGDIKAGSAALFEDPRVNWAIENLARLGTRIEESNVLEMGPLEGGHTYQLARAGAKSVTAVEAHPEAFLKCLVLKELLGTERVNFLFGDGASFLRSIGHSYDIGFACGFLYHMADPVTFLDYLCRRSKAVFIWTVYWDESYSQRNPGRVAGTSGTEKRNYDGLPYTLHRHDYGAGVDYGSFWGGPESHANWMEKDDILKALAHFGFTRQHYELEANPNGSALCLVAAKT
jgi:hypothetical protein